jgi:hypothetical protein
MRADGQEEVYELEDSGTPATCSIPLRNLYKLIMENVLE